MKRTTPYWLLILLYCTSLISYAEEYTTPPPAGIHWGWQGQLFFDLNSAKIHQEYQSLLNQIVEVMTRSAEVSLLITGRADNTGNAEYNKRLSLKRIQSVVDYLTQRGVQAEHIHTQAL
ncbi:MAG: OmpA family protein, partial [Pseudomonadota bacterium]|nr:OmpA family protein [Pseudomonadota bacterium]